MDKPSLTDVYDELHNAVFKSRSIVLACQRSNMAGELSGALDAAFFVLDDAMNLLDGNPKLFGYTSEAANG